MYTKSSEKTSQNIRKRRKRNENIPHLRLHPLQYKGVYKERNLCANLTYRKAQEEKYPYRISVLYRKELEPECDMYVEAKEETE